MKQTLKIDLPELPSLLRALEVRDDPTFDRGVRAAERKLQEARDRQAVIGRDLDIARERVAVGAAAPALLEELLHRAHAAQLVIAPAQEAVREAEAARAAAHDAARKRVHETALDFHDDFQAAADRVGAVLQELRELEAALDRASIAAGGKATPALHWPVSLQEDPTDPRGRQVIPAPARAV